MALTAQSVATVLANLTEQEQAAQLLGHPTIPAVGAAAWVARGIHIETLQYVTGAPHPLND